jgi:hypothetical protein
MKSLLIKLRVKKTEDQVSDLQRIVENLYLLFVSIVSVDF